MSDDIVNIEVNGEPVQARKGQMLIQATDASGHYVPRFCYHDKLPVAANCRMCLVEVEKAPKPVPACATPVTEGMKVFTKSPKAIAAQKAVMEFLLINHPLDCPICDQGGECELQDLAMGFGRDAARYAERKRVVKDKSLGPLVSTDMTRCIHCTRCVRFTSEIQGFQELGTVGRGDRVEIGTYIEKSVEHELSGNIIDLCPVGALNSKPYRYSARAWEMMQQPLVSPHDSVGSNLYAHVLRGRVMRVVPRPNEDINETWIADRDRFSYEGIYSEDRLHKPLIREGNQWREVDWQTALNRAAEKLQAVIRQDAKQLGTLVAPTSTLEEAYLAQRITRELGSNNIDHRLRRSDFRDQNHDPVYPWLGMPIAALEQLNSVLIVGSNLRREFPILAHRIRKAAKAGAQVSFINPVKYEYLFPVTSYLASNGLNTWQHLAAVLSAAMQATNATIPATVSALLSNVQVNDTHRAIASQLLNGTEQNKRRAILLGAIAQRDVAYTEIRALAAVLAQVTGATLGYMADGGNSVAAHIAGAVPHRSVDGQLLYAPGLNAKDMMSARLKAYLIVGALESQDFADVTALSACRGAECVIALSSYACAKDYAHIILPVGTFAETSGTYVNIEGRWQSVAGAATPVGESRPAWKVLRVLGNLLNLASFDYNTSEEVRDEVRKLTASLQADNSYANTMPIHASNNSMTRDIPMYGVDAVVRRATALQLTHEAQSSSWGHS
ncbi:MAG TPA: NADH-quinone oxidoreductase subunit NuoG [Steroidobacteraceae bacterium]|nr:NADH-quinone oxidoreductase subunit NuoG [Steroidobacteraceae bacterium]